MIRSSFQKIAILTLSALVLAACGGTETPNTATDSPKTEVPGLSTEVAKSVDGKSSTESTPIEDEKQNIAKEAESKLPQGWEIYQSPLGRFSIAMPGKPKEEDRPVELPGGESVPLKIASVEESNVAYFTGYVDYPEGLVSNPAVNVQEVLSSSIEGAAANDFGDGELIQTETTVNGVPCRDFKTSGKLDGQNARMEGIFCLEGDRLFEVLIIGEDQPGFPQISQDFRSSFTIQKS
jgi:hypothetical protein